MCRRPWRGTAPTQKAASLSHAPHHAAASATPRARMVALKCPKGIDVLVLPKSAWGVGEFEFEFEFEEEEEEEEEEEGGGIW